MLVSPHRAGYPTACMLVLLMPRHLLCVALTRCGGKQRLGYLDRWPALANLHTYLSQHTLRLLLQHYAIGV